LQYTRGLAEATNVRARKSGTRCAGICPKRGVNRIPNEKETGSNETEKEKEKNGLRDKGNKIKKRSEKDEVKTKNG
jgi:hypothetical protein